MRWLWLVPIGFAAAVYVIAGRPGPWYAVPLLLVPGMALTVLLGAYIAMGMGIMVGVRADRLSEREQFACAILIGVALFVLSLLLARFGDDEPCISGLPYNAGC